MSTVIVALPHLSLHDAVSNDARMQCQCLQARGFQTVLYAETCDDNAKGLSISHQTFATLLADKRNVLIYHMCVYWNKLPAVLAEARCRVAIKYHNMTPPGFFARYDHLSWHATREGLAQAAQVFKNARIDLMLAASPFNLRDVDELSGGRRFHSAVVAPYVIADELAGADIDPALERELAGRKKNFIFVGRLVPNKGHLHLVAVARSYRDLFGDNFRLTMIGKASANFAKYRRDIEEFIAKLDLADNISIADSVNLAQLSTYYRRADCFLSMSEHEGFCVPIVEAQILGLPVVALERAAVKDTIGEGQLSWEEADHDVFAAALHQLVTDAELRKTIIERGRQNAMQYKEDKVTDGLVHALASIDN